MNKDFERTMDTYLHIISSAKHAVSGSDEDFIVEYELRNFNVEVQVSDGTVGGVLVHRKKGRSNQPPQSDKRKYGVIQIPIGGDEDMSLALVFEPTGFHGSYRVRRLAVLSNDIDANKHIRYGYENNSEDELSDDDKVCEGKTTERLFWGNDFL